MERVIKLKLQGMLQSYSNDCIFTNTRDTQVIPTKTAIVGMLAGAEGIDRKYQDKIHALSDKVSVYVKPNQKIAIKYSDFQRVCGKSFRTASGSRKDNLPLFEKEYLENADFDIYIVCDENIAEELSYALQHPVYPTVLGRKCCIPATRVFQGLLDNFGEEEKTQCIYLS